MLSQVEQQASKLAVLQAESMAAEQQLVQQRRHREEAEQKAEYETNCKSTDWNGD